MSYPKLKINLESIRRNTKEITCRAKEKGIDIFGVVKVANGIFEVAEAMVEGGCVGIASSRIRHLHSFKEKGLDVPMMLVRIPMISEANEVVGYSDISLQSDMKVLSAINDEAVKLGKSHGVILMKDVGDLREGFWSDSDLMEAAEFTESAKGLSLMGIGTNVGCYGSVVPTNEKLDELALSAGKIEDLIDRKLQYISGGATSSFARIIDDDMPNKINMLRMGEGILFGDDLVEGYGYEMPYINHRSFILEAEVVEVKKKPSHPVGQLAFDAFGRTPEYNDIGIRRRALLAVGKADYGDEGGLTALKPGIKVIGASSDHTILDITDADFDICVGDKVALVLKYQNVLYATNTADIKVLIR